MRKPVASFTHSVATLQVIETVNGSTSVIASSNQGDVTGGVAESSSNRPQPKEMGEMVVGKWRPRRMAWISVDGFKKNVSHSWAELFLTGSQRNWREEGHGPPVGASASEPEVARHVTGRHHVTLADVTPPNFPTRFPRVAGSSLGPISPNFLLVETSSSFLANFLSISFFDC